METREWNIKIIDTGESIKAICGKHRVVEKYNPERGQTEHAERDEAVGAVFARLSDVFDKE